MISKIEKLKLKYNDKVVKGKKLIVSSELPISLNIAWNEVQKSELLEFVSKGKIKFKPVNKEFPKFWKERMIVETRMFLFGLIPFGGVHTITFTKIDEKNKVCKTIERDNLVKIWNHKISMTEIETNRIRYEDEIEIFGGLLTYFITFWANTFYKHRQRRWLLVAAKFTI